MSDESQFSHKRESSQPELPLAPTELLPKSNESDASEPPKIIGGLYEIIGVLGQGGMGSVLKARNQRLQSKLYAVKVLNPASMANDSTIKQRFEIEAQATARLSHPHLVTVFDYGFTADGAPYLVMEYLEGSSLDRVLKSEPRLTADQLLPVFIQVAKALQYVHAQNIVHRDLKPHNIMVQEIADERYAKIIDLGIAKVFTEDGKTAQHLTATGMVFGSPHYMSPEQCKGDKIDPRTDIYSLGCVMYECLSDGPPFQGENSLQTLFKQVTEQPAPLQCDSALGRELAVIIERCMQKDPAHRFQTAGDLLSALSKAEGSAKKLSHSTGLLERRVLPEPLHQQKRTDSTYPQPHGAQSQSQGLDTVGQASRRMPTRPHVEMLPPAPDRSNSSQMILVAAVAVGVIILGLVLFQAYNQSVAMTQSAIRQAVGPNAPSSQPSLGQPGHSSLPTAMTQLPPAAVQQPANVGVQASNLLQPAASNGGQPPSLTGRFPGGAAVQVPSSMVQTPASNAAQSLPLTAQPSVPNAVQPAVQTFGQNPIDYQAMVQRLGQDQDRNYAASLRRMQQVQEMQGNQQVQSDVNRYWNNVHEGMEGANQRLEQQNAQYHTNGR